MESTFSFLFISHSDACNLLFSTIINKPERRSHRPQLEDKGTEIPLRRGSRTHDPTGNFLIILFYEFKTWNEKEVNDGSHDSWRNGTSEMLLFYIFQFLQRRLLHSARTRSGKTATTYPLIAHRQQHFNIGSSFRVNSNWDEQNSRGNVNSKFLCLLKNSRKSP
jgi:hypothetical protein